ncbi:inner-membrane translocator [Peribacillus deserti]|uniref:Inner-membrane translocator n=1 Tax=Peribacillus deserti TaxID=673318 RepID=A0A2N5M123_9BACI|nr:inner-membrane translocator [Peribacillus deserti]PLT28058.1 inner-membrane translocator [Peribacillus deserti]
MESIILVVFILVITSLNILFYLLYRKGKLSLIVSGLIMMMLAPLLGFFSGALLHQFYDWNSGGTGEGAGYGGAILGLLTFVNGIIILVTGIIRSIYQFIKKNMNGTM